MKKKRRLRLHMVSMFFIFLLVLSGSFSAFAKADSSSIEPEKLETQQKEEGAIFEDDPPEIQGDIEDLDEGLEDGEEIFTEEVPQAEDIFQSEEEAEPLPEEEEPGKTPEGDMEIQEDPAPGSMSVFTDGAGETAGSHTIIHENGLHYIEDPQYPGYRIVLYCMNNELNWPHHTEEMGEHQVPGYTEGYLTPDMFHSVEEYEDCMRRLSKLLYAGYPYNGERLYKIVPDSQLYIPTEEEFDKMLVPLPILQTAFPELGHHVFLYQDWVKQDMEHLEILGQFIHHVEELRRGGSTPNGLIYEEITVMPFYKAAMSMIWQSNVTPLENFAHLYGDSYFVTEEQAYNATQLAIWRLMNFYDIPDNNIDDGELNASALGKTLYTYSERGGLLDHEPSASELRLEADLIFRYNPKDGMYHSGDIRIIEPENYHGLYNLILPEGVTAQCDNLTYVYGGEDYQLVAKEQPVDGANFGIRADFVWLEDFKQYSPQPDIEVNGKKFQHMIGAVIRNASINAQIPYDVRDEGGIRISKQVVEEGGDQNREFGFRLELPYHDHIEGLYGDLFFHEGVAEFTLKAGESKKAVHLPAGAEYKVTETDTGEYEIGSVNDFGTIQKGKVQEVVFTNIRLPELILSKEVTGEAGDKTREFHFGITLNDAGGNPVNGTFSYSGSIKAGCEDQGMTAPKDGILEFKDGKAEILLSHGQQISIKNLPYKSSYTVIEKEAGQDFYDTSYNGSDKNAAGILETNTEIHVVNHKEFVPDTGVMDSQGKGTAAGTAIALLGMLLLTGERFLKKRIRK